MKNKKSKEIDSGVCNTFPKKIQFSPTEKCNLNCIHCYRQDYKDSLLVEDMDINILNCETVNIAMKEVKEAWIVSGGEPLLYKDFFNVVDCLVKKGVSEIYSITNGTVITDNIAKSIVNSGITNLKISIDGATVETVDKIRGVGVFNNIIEGIKRINQYKELYKSNTPNLIFNFVVMRINYKELFKLVLLAKKLGVNSIEAHKCQQLNTNIKNLDMKELGQEFEVELSKAQKIAGEEGIKLKSYNEVGEEMAQNGEKCIEPWEFFYVAQNGDVYPCCHLWGNPFGNVWSQSFEEIWNGEKMKEIRNEIKNKGYAKLCLESACPKMAKEDNGSDSGMLTM